MILPYFIKFVYSLLFLSVECRYLKIFRSANVELSSETDSSKLSIPEMNSNNNSFLKKRFRRETVDGRLSKFFLLNKE